jgi:proline iminopeptidase
VKGRAANAGNLAVDTSRRATCATVTRMTTEQPAIRTLYPEIEPFRTATLRVSDLHELYFEESGNPNGKPVLFVHGGPGGGTEAKMRRYFDPAKYRIVLFDQRGCGKSTPHAELRENTTWDLVADMEKLRLELGIERWMVFGGSWGSTLALAYSEAHPTRVTELVLRGIFLVRQQEIDWFYQRGASAIFPDAWEGYLAPIPMSERDDLVKAYHRRLTSDDAATRQQAARAWSVWEGSTSRLRPDPELVARTGGDDFSLAFARIECHYFVNRAFLRSEQQLLEDVEKIRHIPAVIVQGRYDVVCPMETAWALSRAWPEAQLQIIEDAGHAAAEPGTTSALIVATDAFAQRP